MRFFTVSKIIKPVVENLKPKNAETMSNLCVISIILLVANNIELVCMILLCIAQNEPDLVKDPEIIKLIFGLVKVKINK